MAQFYKAKKQTSSRKNRTTQTSSVLEKLEMMVDVIDHHGNGICLSHKPIIVVPAAIPGELYQIQIVSKKQKVWHGKVSKVLQKHEHARVTPFCSYVDTCGGCSHQAFKAEYLIEAKQRSLRTYLSKIIPPSRLKNSTWEDTVHSDISDERSADSNQGEFAYRRRARIAIDARNSKDIKVGFRQEKSNKVVDIPSCPILAKPIQSAYEQLTALIKCLPSALSIGHITVTAGAQRNQVCLHLTDTLCQESIDMLIEQQIAQQKLSGLDYLVETKSGKLVDVNVLGRKNEGSKTVHDTELFICDAPPVKLSIRSNNFIQVNQHVNSRMLEISLDWLKPTANDVLVDLFCGVGNFSLNLAKHCKEVIGVEGVTEMVQQASSNAQLNGIHNSRFVHFDLNDLHSLSSLNIPDGALFVVDPSRVGALEVMKVIGRFKPKKILYVSCNPTSFARDVDALPSNYDIVKMRALDMFPFTKHIEMVALISST